MVQRLTAVLSNCFPGFAKQVRLTDVATPLTYWRSTRSWRGAFEGWMPKDGSFFARVEKTLSGLRGFYMAGQWVEPGGGVPTTVLSGRHVVQLICADDERPFVAVRAGSSPRSAIVVRLAQRILRLRLALPTSRYPPRCARRTGGPVDPPRELSSRSLKGGACGGRNPQVPPGLDSVVSSDATTPRCSRHSRRAIRTSCRRRAARPLPRTTRGSKRLALTGRFFRLSPADSAGRQFFTMG